MVSLHLINTYGIIITYIRMYSVIQIKLYIGNLITIHNNGVDHYRKTYGLFDLRETAVVYYN